MKIVLNQLVYFGYLQCIFLVVIYLFAPKNRDQINVFLKIFIVALMIGLTGKVLYNLGVFGDDSRVIVISEFATLLFGPTIYLFTRSSLTSSKYINSDLLHFVPAILYNMLVIYVFVIRVETPSPFWLTMIIIGVGLLFNVCYYLLSLSVFFSFRKKVKEEVSFNITTQFFVNFLIAVGVCLLCWLALYVNGLLRFPLFTRTSWQIVWVSLSIVILFIAYYGMKNPELYKIAPQVTQKKYSNSKLTDEDLDDLKIKLDRIMISKKPYLNRKLLKSELASLLEVNNPDIARLLNERIGMNFYEFVNFHRIKEFIQLTKTKELEHLTLFGIAQEAGFNSKSTFNKAFKQLMGTTPKDYFSKIEE